MRIRSEKLQGYLIDLIISFCNTTPDPPNPRSICIINLDTFCNKVNTNFPDVSKFLKVYILIHNVTLAIIVFVHVFNSILFLQMYAILNMQNRPDKSANSSSPPNAILCSSCFVWNPSDNYFWIGKK